MGAKSYESKNETRRSKTQRHSPKERSAFLVGDAFHGYELMDSPAPHQDVDKYDAEADEPEISAQCIHHVRVHRVPLIGSRCLTNRAQAAGDVRTGARDRPPRWRARQGKGRFL